jgi:uncharacterized protein YlxP (DUF503 family)
MMRLVIELPEMGSIKDKRSVVSRTKEKLRHRFRLSCAEIGLQDSLGFAELGSAYVSNSGELGEKVMQKALAFVEDSLALKVYDVQIHSENYGD